MGLAGFLFGRALSMRIGELTDAVKRMSVGELSTVVQAQDPLLPGWMPIFIAQDELNRLAEQLDQMRESFRQAIERLRKR